MSKVSLFIDQRLSRIQKKTSAYEGGYFRISCTCDVYEVQILWNLALLCWFW